MPKQFGMGRVDNGTHCATDFVMARKKNQTIFSLQFNLQNLCLGYLLFLSYSISGVEKGLKREF